MVQNIDSNDSFYQELIRRFFHPNSYFHHCVNHHLNKLIQSKENFNNEDHLLFCNLLDHLVAAENKVEELLRISAINGFHNFLENLNNKVEYLRDSDLTPEQLKIEIEGLAQSMIKTAMSALQHHDSKEKLKEYLGIKNTKRDDSLSKQVHDQKSKPVDDSKTTEITEPPSAVPGNAEPELTQQSPPYFSEFSVEEESDILRTTDVGKDALAEHGNDSDQNREGGSVDIKPQNNDKHKDQVDQEPGSVIRVFLTAMKLHLEQLQETLALLSSDNRNKNHWLECSKIFENIKANAMIYGFDAFEQIAQTSINFVSKSIREIGNPDPSAIALLGETANVLNKLIQGDLEKLDDKVIIDHIQKLKNHKESLTEEKIESQENSSTNLKKNTELDEIESKEAAIQKVHPQKNINDAPISQQVINETSDFKLPGEDDEEILSLVRDISENNLQKNDSITNFSDSTESPTFAPIEKSEQPIIKNEEPEHSLTEVVDPSADDQLKAFREEAELYFSVIEEALKTLEAKPNNRTAMDDLELASYSLYGLTVKMNLEPLGQLPASIESLIKIKNSKKSSLSRKERQIIKEAYTQFRNMTRIEESEKRQFKELLASLQELNLTTKRVPRRDQYEPLSAKE
ncbi:MAG: hypothetical protein ACE5IW_02895 [bacterium]